MSETRVKRKSLTYYSLVYSFATLINFIISIEMVLGYVGLMTTSWTMMKRGKSRNPPTVR